MDGTYSPAEVVFLLSLSQEDAQDFSVRWADSCRDLSSDGPSSAAGREHDPLPLIARWVDVRAARRRVVRAKEADAVLELRLAGHTERDVAEQTGLSAATVHRRFRATVQEILTELGTQPVADAPERLSRVSACLKCGQHPRARVRAKIMLVAGVSRRIDERQIGTCAGCTDEAYQPELLEAPA